MLYLVFGTADRLFALPAGEVEVVLPVPQLTPLADGPMGCVGWLHYRGREVQVMDFALMAFGSVTERLISTRLILIRSLDSGNSVWALMVEHVLELMPLEPLAISDGWPEEPVDWLFPEALGDASHTVHRLNWRAFFSQASSNGVSLMGKP